MSNSLAIKTGTGFRRAVGIEASDCIDTGELSRLYDRAERMATIRSFVGPKDLLALPKFDAGSACRSSTISPRLRPRDCENS